MGVGALESLNSRTKVIIYIYIYIYINIYIYIPGKPKTQNLLVIMGKSRNDLFLLVKYCFYP